IESSINTTSGSTDTTWTSIGRTHSSKLGSFGLGLLSIPWSNYRYNQSATDTLRTSTKTIQVSSQSSTSPALLPIL
ncbi:hypothetical protein Golob_004800, partial [Gossypium lobatum]|nr:hypothetical protein [Gossypium lobatum]